MIIAFHKPYGVISQFTPEVAGQRTLAEFEFLKSIYPIGRLDLDSEGLLLLSDEKSLTDRLLNPERNMERTYHAQIEGAITEQALASLRKGVKVQDYKTKPCKAAKIDEAPHPERKPPIRFRKLIPTSWIELTLTEGKNREVRRMCAAVGFPVLRLIRVSIGKLPLGSLPCGEWKVLSDHDRKLLGIDKALHYGG